jgi:hypothetical protein
MQLMVAVDFTLSNRPPLERSSLHFVDPDDRMSLNQYAQAIISVCEILAPYCGGMKKMICPLFGFGGQLSPDSPVSHCFPMTGTSPQPVSLPCPSSLPSLSVSVASHDLLVLVFLGSDNFAVQGVYDIVNAYYSTLAQVTLSGTSPLLLLPPLLLLTMSR